MTDNDPLTIRPTRRERRGDFPRHTAAEPEQHQLSAEDARDLAARRLAEHHTGPIYRRRDTTDE